MLVCVDLELALFPQVSMAVGLAVFACVILVVLFVLINKYGRRSKFIIKGEYCPFHEEVINNMC